MAIFSGPSSISDIWINMANSSLSSSQRISFLGAVLDSAQMRAMINQACCIFQGLGLIPFGMFQRMLGLMAFASSVLQTGPAIDAAPTVLAETPSSSPRLASRMPPYQTTPAPWPWPLGGTLVGSNLAWPWLHINCLEMPAVFLALRTFLPDLRGHLVLVRSDNMAVVSYIIQQSRFRSRPLYKQARRRLL